MRPSGGFSVTESLTRRVEEIERRNIKAEALHERLVAADSATAEAVRDLTRIINDPRSGLIVELDKFREEVAQDRREFRAWVRGATAILSVVFGLVTILAPWIRAIVEQAVGVRVPG